METNQAAEHLQVIRTLMERSALYRRALAPIMMFCGGVGIGAGIFGWHWPVRLDAGFVFYWGAVAAVALGGSLLLVRRQALRESEPFWSAPTKRVSQAMLPPMMVGVFLGFLTWLSGAQGETLLSLAWASLYGCALHSAGFVISRGFRLFGWIFTAIGCVSIAVLILSKDCSMNPNPHLVMGGLFGGLHLAYGIYLYFTENRKTAP